MNTKLLALATIAFATTAASSFARHEGKQFADRPDPEDIVAEIVAEYDVNEDNLITVDELESAIVGMHEKRIGHMKALAEKRGFDTDSERPHHPRGDGFQPEPSDIAAKLVAKFDNDGDEALDTEELMGAIDAMHRHGPKGKRGPGPRGKRGHGGHRGGE